MHRFSLKFRLVVMVLLFCFLPGCWDNRNIEDMNYPSALGIDRGREAGKYDVTVFIPLTKAVTGGAQEGKDQGKRKEQALVFTVEDLLPGATRDERQHLESKRLMIGEGLDAVVFSEEVAREGLQKHLDALWRNPRMAGTVLYAVAEGKAEELLAVTPKENPDVGIYIGELIRASSRYFMPRVTMNQFMIAFYSPGDNPILPVLRAGEKKIEVAGAAVFDHDKMIAKLSKEETQALLILRQAKAAGTLTFGVPDGEGGTDFVTCGVKTKRKVIPGYADGRFTFRIEVTLEGEIIEHSGTKNFIKEKDYLKTVEAALNWMVEENTRAFVRKMQQEWKTDALGLGKYARAKCFQQFEQTDWHEAIQQADIQVDVKTKIERFGAAT